MAHARAPPPLEPRHVAQVRTVCKAEWAYEAAIVFDSLDNFKGEHAAAPPLRAASCLHPACVPQLARHTIGYMGSEVREQNLLPKFAELSKLATKPDAVYSGNRVYNEL